MAIVFEEKTIGSVKKIKATITSASDGSASGTTTAAFDGKILLLTTDPDGTDAPSDNWDLAVTDDDGVDVLAGAGANRSTSSTQQVVSSSLGAVASSKLTFSATNMGDTNVAVAYLYIR